MNLLLEPPLGQWHLGACRGLDRTALAALVNAQSPALGGATLDIACPVIATGHQPWLWHSGILAKDVVMARVARRLHAGMCHVVVDHQEEFTALRVQLPVHRDGRLGAEPVDLAAHLPGVPTASQPGVDAAAAGAALRAARDRLGAALRADLQPLIAAFGDLPACCTLAQQVTAVLNRLMRPWADPPPVLFSTQLLALPRGRELVARMLYDARRCVAAYNQAVARHPHAGIAPLRAEPDRVELPLWYLAWRAPRRRVFADLADRVPLLVLENGQPVDLVALAAGGAAGAPCEAPRLAPKALLLTVMMRRWECDLFIHGKGGGGYDRVMEQWWRAWTGDDLAPMTVVSADLHLPVPAGAPLAEDVDLRRAVWWNHHLPHNPDRALAQIRAAWPEDAPLIARKHALLGHMDDDRDRPRRAAAFDELHRLNRALMAAHPELGAAAVDQLAAARTGLGNRAFAAKRDWCFALYPPRELAALAQAVEAEVDRLPSPPVGAGAGKSVQCPP